MFEGFGVRLFTGPRALIRQCTRKKSGEDWRVRLKNGFFVGLGSVSLALGITAIFLPVIPMTPFLLLAAWCYLRGSKRMHRWLLSQRHLGAHIRAFEEGRGISRRAKILAFVTLWTSITLVIWLVDTFMLRFVLFAAAAGVSVWLLRMPTLNSRPSK